MIRKELDKLCKRDARTGKLDLEDPKKVCEDLFEEIDRMQGRFHGDGKPKTGEEFWYKVERKAREKKIEVTEQVILNAAQDCREALKFSDLCFYIFQVEKEFPTGFCMQPLEKNPIKNPISSARFAELSIIEWAENVQKVLDQSDKNQLYLELLSILIANVQGGVASYVKIFFSEDGYQ